MNKLLKESSVLLQYESIERLVLKLKTKVKINYIAKNNKEKNVACLLQLNMLMVVLTEMFTFKVLHI